MSYNRGINVNDKFPLTTGDGAAVQLYEPCKIGTDTQRLLAEICR